MCHMRLLILLLLSVPSLYATRYEFVNPFFQAPLGSEDTAFIETMTPTGVDVPILDAVAAFQFRGLTGRERRPAGHPGTAVRPLDGWSILGTMTWDLTSLTGIWSLSSPPIEALPPLIGATQYVVRSDGLDSKWPLDYFPSQSFLQGQWHAVPDAGSTLLLMLGSLAGIFLLTRFTPRAIVLAE